MPADYSFGKIYTVRCRTDDKLIYVGSTIQTLSMRLVGHKSSCAYGSMTCLLYDAVRKDDMGWDNWYIELLELYSCTCKDELRRREGHFIREMGSLNKNIAGRTTKECNKAYYESNKEHSAEYSKEYVRKNEEKTKTYQALYRQEHQEENKHYMLEYHTNNKESIAKKKQENYQKNIEKITCVCGCIMIKHNLLKHIKSRKHIIFLENK
jgi:hypothetical protein